MLSIQYLAAGYYYDSPQFDWVAFFVVWFFVALIFGFIGALVGNSKGRAVEGLILGAALGLIGLIIIAVIGPSSAKAMPTRPNRAIDIVRATPGWYPDPYQKHELRYFDGQQWRDRVSDNGVPGFDPPPPPPPRTASGQ